MRRLFGYRYYHPGHRGCWMWPQWLCAVMNALDWRYWRCDCEYVAPYGLVISADCGRHD